MTLARLQEHAAIWAAKPELRRVYQVWFDALLARAPIGARVVEVGAGTGALAAHARAARPDLAWVATELAPTPWNDVVADAGALPFRDAVAGAVLGVDVLHHLPDPRAFFREAARLLRPRGCLALVEPWVTPFSFPIYRFLHQEDCRRPRDPWRPFAEAGPGKDLFDGNAAIPHAIVRAGAPGFWGEVGLSAPEVTRRNAFAYLLTLGFRRRSLLPPPLTRPLLRVDEVLQPTAALTGLRAMLVWTRLAGGEGAKA
jgi:SAM-dependent methyltransferase